MTSHSPVESVIRSPIWSSIGTTRVVPGGSGGGIPGNGGCTGLAFWRFFSGRGLAIQKHLSRPYTTLAGARGDPLSIKAERPTNNVEPRNAFIAVLGDAYMGNRNH